MIDAPAPTPPRVDLAPEPQPPRPRFSLLPAVGFLAVLGVIAAMFVNGTERQAPASKRQNVKTSPVVDQEPTAPPTQAHLDAKMERVAFYLGRGSEEGASQILYDTFHTTACSEVYRAYIGLPTLRVAKSRSAEFRARAHDAFVDGDVVSYLISTGIAKSESPKLVQANQGLSYPGTYVMAGVIFSCPSEAA